MRTCLILFSAIFLISLSSCANYVSPSPTNLAVIKTAPKHYKIVKVKGKKYYFWNGKHYKKTRRGYFVVRV
ncbi:DUF6515 family protein [uncultured Algibacter sp.]|uniref:DUF6515 family protein n=1 Tax=uncultured Algibacter sp. TaxID=298659 RepID=UPI0026053A35|nr:DUF6515 family protein [uncultured Algibacter sp.]